MPTLNVFNNVSLDGYFCGSEGDLSWAYQDPHDDEWNAFVANNAKGGGTLVFGRITYQMMAGYWPTASAAQQNPSLAKYMNAIPKVVFSRTMTEAAWSNTQLLRGDLIEEVRRLKGEPGTGLTILGSGSLISQLTAARLIDQYQVVVKPLVLGQGRSMFHGIGNRVALRQTGARAFGNGNVLLSYAL